MLDLITHELQQTCCCQKPIVEAPALLSLQLVLKCCVVVFFLLVFCLFVFFSVLAEFHIPQSDTPLFFMPSSTPSAVALQGGGACGGSRWGCTVWPLWSKVRGGQTNGHKQGRGCGAALRLTAVVECYFFCHFQWIKGSWCCPFNHVKQIMLVRQRRSIGEAATLSRQKGRSDSAPQWLTWATATKLQIIFWWSKDECLCLSEAPFVLFFCFFLPWDIQTQCTTNSIQKSELCPGNNSDPQCRLEQPITEPNWKQLRHQWAGHGTEQNTALQHAEPQHRAAPEHTAHMSSTSRSSNRCWIHPRTKYIRWMIVSSWLTIRCRSDLIFDDPIWTSSGFSGSQTSTPSPAQSSWQNDKNRGRCDLALWSRCSEGSHLISQILHLAPFKTNYQL